MTHAPTRLPDHPGGRTVAAACVTFCVAVALAPLGACGAQVAPQAENPPCRAAHASALAARDRLERRGLRTTARLTLEALDRQLRAVADTCGPRPEAREALLARATLRDAAARVTRAPEDMRAALLAWADVDGPGAPPEEVARSLWARADLALVFDERSEGFSLLAQLWERHPKTPEGDRARRAIALLTPLAPDLAQGASPVSSTPPRPEPLPESAYPGQVLDPDRLGIPFRASGERPARLTGLGRWSTSDFARVVLTFSEPVRYQQGLLAPSGGRPARLYIDFSSAVLSPQVERAQTMEGHLVHGLRLGNHTPTTARMVADLSGPLRYEIYPLMQPYRVVLDLWRQGTRPVSGAPTQGLVEPPPVRVVALDPGHGGSEDGAVGPAGTKEKHITLAVARQVAERLRRGGLKVVLTRDGDQRVTLEERTALALIAGADLFVSIHANAEPTGTHSGIETYFLDVEDEKYSSRLASRESRAAGQPVSPDRLLLADLATRLTTAHSKRLALAVHAALLTEARRHRPEVPDRGVRPGIFHVLMTARVPAILTEISFLSHPGEETALNDPAYQSHLAEGIARGILAYARSQARPAKAPPPPPAPRHRPR